MKRPLLRERLGLVALAYAFKVVFGLAIALPFAFEIGSRVKGYPDVDAALTEPGGLVLLEALRFARHAASGLLVSTAGMAVVATVAGLLPLGFLLHGLAHPGRLGFGDVAAFATRRLGALAVFAVLTGVLQVSVGGLLLICGAQVVDALRLDAPAEDFAHLGVVGLILVVCTAAGVVRDLASVAATSSLGEPRLGECLATAFRTVGRRGGRLFVGYAWRAALALEVFAIALRLGDEPYAFAVRQAGVFGLVALRASWLSAAIRLTDAANPAEPSAPEPVAASPSEPSASEPAAASPGEASGTP